MRSIQPDLTERLEPYLPKPNFLFRLDKYNVDFEDLQATLEHAIEVIREERTRFASSGTIFCDDSKIDPRMTPVWPEAV